LLTLVNNKINN